MLKDKLIESFNRIGFDEYREINSEDILFSKDVFNQCAKNTCGNYGKNHACPPLSGTELENKKRVLKYKTGFLLSKIVSVRSQEEMMESSEIVNKSVNELRKSFDHEDVLILGVGPCTICETCSALEGNPCRFPQRTQYSMEGCGIDVMRMSMNHKMTYNAGAGKVGFFSLVLYT